MTFVLDRARISRLCQFVDQLVRKNGCDHSHRFTLQWAAAESIDCDDLLDVLEANGAFCDCEAVLNLSEDTDLEASLATTPAKIDNLWLLPPGFTFKPTDSFNKWIVSVPGVGRNTHTDDGELLVPAPKGAKPNGRVRKIVHFFIGCESGKASEVGVVQICEAISAEDFVQRVVSGHVASLASFGAREAAFLLSKVAALAHGTTVGTDFSERVGVASKHEQLTIHRVLLRR